MSQNPFLETLKNCPCSAHYTILLKSAIAEVLFFFTKNLKKKKHMFNSLILHRTWLNREKAMVCTVHAVQSTPKAKHESA